MKTLRSGATLVSQGHTSVVVFVDLSGLHCTRGNGDIKTRLLPRTMSWFMVLPRLWSVLKSKLCIATKGRIISPGFGPQSDALVVMGARLQPGPSRLEWPMLPPRARMSSTPKLLPAIMSGSVFQIQLESVTCVTSETHRNHVG